MKKGLLIFPILLLICFGLRYNILPLFSVAEYRFVQTGFLSNDHFSSIKSYAIQLFNNHCEAHHLIARLKKEFSTLDKIEIAYRPCGTYVMLHVHKPVCCINECYVLTSSHQLLASDYFSPKVLAAIPIVTVAQNYLSKSLPVVPSLLSQLPPEFKNAYDLTLLNEHEVHLHSKHEKNLNIITHATQEKLPYVLGQCDRVRKKLVEGKNYNQKNNWIIDTRFADYIIAYKA